MRAFSAPGFESPQLHIRKKANKQRGAHKEGRCLCLTEEKFIPTDPPQAESIGKSRLVLATLF